MKDESFCDREPFFIQWHITDQCNQTCRHCYRGAARSEPSDALIARVLDQIQEISRQVPQQKTRVQITGGEPVMSPHLFSAIEELAGWGIGSRILSNGTLIDSVRATRLKAAGCAIVQVSLEGTPRTHDRIRGNGSFAAAERGIRALKAAGLSVTLAMTLSQETVADVPFILEYAERYADRIGFHRLVPCGRGAGQQILSSKQLEEVYKVILNFQKSKPKIEIPLRDPLWNIFRSSHCSHITGCSAGYAGLCIDVNGCVYPCRRVPISLGNVMDCDLHDLWCGDVMDSLRDRNALQGRCGACSLRWKCGGCRGVALAVNGHLLAEDPQCFRQAGLHGS